MNCIDRRRREIVPLTSSVVTLWYSPPERLVGATHYGVVVDLWSTGCILGELYAGKLIMPVRTEQCSNLTQPYRRWIEETFIDVPSFAITLIETLLAIDRSERQTASSAFKSEFFTTKPHDCDPSSLPKYPPSKEIDAKLREEEARRQRAECKGQKAEKESRGPRDPQEISVPDANADPRLSHYSKDSIDDSKPPQPPMPESYYGPLIAGSWTKSTKNYDDVSTTSRADLSSLSGLLSSGYRNTPKISVTWKNMTGKI
ncbi:hypothetical protein L2E82_47951 [Cichorium intybus]|uniref:Uncharacterized protein n=1 Tax=Cichorium intybus TaxID=13427 RepID=A0ACB8YYE1_CICIN|nr:hypothetical protein L2E82_47951 [Cichorium intybus]